MKQLWQVQGTYFVAGFETIGGIVQIAAPILAQFMGKTLAQVQRTCVQCRWTLIQVR